MKPAIEMPSESVMTFFAPELFLRFNSADDDVADRADEDWEEASAAYERRLGELRDQMPPHVRKLADLNLHDAELISLDQPVEPFFSTVESAPAWTAFGILPLKQGDEIVSLIYALWDSVREYEAKEDWPFSKFRPHWLYEEVEVAPNKPWHFFHRILLSDGRVIEIPFVSALIHRLPLPTSVRPNSPRQSA